MDQAIELKKQQEKFIDMTRKFSPKVYHELNCQTRDENPLSALIGCADEIITSLRTIVPPFKSCHQWLYHRCCDTIHLLDEAAEAAETIIYCAIHRSDYR